MLKKNALPKQFFLFNILFSLKIYTTYSVIVILLALFIPNFIRNKLAKILLKKTSHLESPEQGYFRALQNNLISAKMWYSGCSNRIPPMYFYPILSHSAQDWINRCIMLTPYLAIPSGKQIFASGHNNSEHGATRGNQ